MSCAGSLELLDEPSHRHFARLHEPYAFLTPFLEQVLGDIPIDRLHRIHDREEAYLRPMLEQTLDRVLVADVERHAVQHDVVGPKGIEDGQNIGIGENVETMLMEENVATMIADLGRERRWILRLGLDNEWIAQRRFRDLPLPRRAPQTVRRKRGFPIGRRGDLGVLADVVVRTRHDADAVAVRVVSQLAEVGYELLGIGHVELAVRLHEVVLSVNVPENYSRCGHGTGNLDGAKASALPPPHRRHAGAGSARSQPRP